MLVNIHLICLGGLGAYSDSRGNPYIRGEIADFISRKHSVPKESVENVFIQNGASECVRLVLRALIRGPNDGIMVPLPQYPLYSASIQLFNGSLIGYYLDGKYSVYEVILICLQFPRVCFHCFRGRGLVFGCE